MSLELIPTIEKNESTKKKITTNVTPESKKETSSLFDSLLKDAIKQKPLSESSKGKSSNDNSEFTEKKTLKKQISSESKKETESLPKTTNAVNKMVNSLVDIVVDTSKKQSKNLEKSLKSEKTDKIERLNTDVDIKLKIENKELVTESKSTIIDSTKKEKTNTEGNKVQKTLESNLSKIKNSTDSIAEKLEQPAIKEVKTTSEGNKIEKALESNLSEIKKSTESIVEKLEQPASKEVDVIETKKGSLNLANKVSSEMTEKVIDKDITVIEKAVKNIAKEIDKIVEEKPLSKAEQKTEQLVDNKKTIKEIDNNISLESKTLNKSEEIKKETIVGEKKLERPMKDSIKSNIQIIETNIKTIKDDLNVDDNSEKLESKPKENVSLKLVEIEKATENISNEISKVIFVSSEELIQNIKEFKKEQALNSEKTKLVVINSDSLESEAAIDKKSNEKSSILSNSFLTSQKQEKQQVSMKNIHDAKKNIEDNKTITSIKESAKTLELNPDELSIEKVGEEGESKSELFAKNTKQIQDQFYQNKSLNKIVIDNQVNSEEIEQNVKRKNIETKIVQEQTNTDIKQKEATINVNVPQTVVETIHSKIVGAHQRVGSFMSEVARNMYLNYKPPFTAFRMNLNPANLGSISIIMRANNNDSSLNISMNMNNSSTMETFSDNKVALQNALQRQLGENTNITLDFGMQNSDNGESFNEQMGDKDQSNESNLQSNNQSTSENSIDKEEQDISATYA